LEHFGPGDPHLTRRKLNFWLKSLNRPKKGKKALEIILNFYIEKGKKSTDPERNKALLQWITDFNKENGRNPNRRELRKKALEVSTEVGFKASKGWLDKFCKKFKIRLHPLKTSSVPAIKEEEFDFSPTSTNIHSFLSYGFPSKEGSPVWHSGTGSESPCSQCAKEKSHKFHEKQKLHKVKHSNTKDDKCPLNSYFNYGNDERPVIYDVIPSLESEMRFLF